MEDCTKTLLQLKSAVAGLSKEEMLVLSSNLLQYSRYIVSELRPRSNIFYIIVPYQQDIKEVDQLSQALTRYGLEVTRIDNNIMINNGKKDGDYRIICTTLNAYIEPVHAYRDYICTSTKDMIDAWIDIKDTIESRK